MDRECGLTESLEGCFHGDKVELRQGWSAIRHQTLPTDLPVDLFDSISSDSSGLRSADSDNTSRARNHKNSATTISRRKAAGSSPSRQDGLPEIGSVVEKYRLDKLLGTGGFAAVYRANHLLLRVPFALKLLLPRVVKANPSFAEMLCEEARFAAQISHPNVVRVFDVTRTEEIAYIVMEYVDGMPLSAAIGNGKLSPREVLRVGLCVCAGLKAALNAGLIHRDIKPANILLPTNGSGAKITDLGLARPTFECREKVGEVHVFPANAFVGTPVYMSPEQALHPERADFRADMYSLGVTLYHAATGSPPFSHSDPLVLVLRHKEHPVPPVGSVIPGFPEDVSRILHRLLMKKPEERYDSYDELEQDLESALNAIPDTNNTPGEKSERNTLLLKIRKFFG